MNYHLAPEEAKGHGRGNVKYATLCLSAERYDCKPLLENSFHSKRIAFRLYPRRNCENSSSESRVGHDGENIVNVYVWLPQATGRYKA